nr:hypothetical protein [Tanacetum cinerariifolium]GEX72932.1 hypothetical protein [Tanacetum cinerariifolium]
MINSIKNGDQPLLTVTQVSITGATSSEQHSFKDKSMWPDQEKKIEKIDRLARSLLIQGLLNDIYSLIDINKIAKDLWDALERHMIGSEYGEQDKKAAVLYEYETFKATEGELLLDTYIRYLQRDVNDAMKSKKKAVLITSDPLALAVEQTKEINANMVFMAQMEKVLLDFEKSSSSLDDTIAEQTSSLKPYVPTVILEKIIIDLEDEVVSLLDKDKENLKITVSLQSKGYLDTFSSVIRPNEGVVISQSHMRRNGRIDVENC